ncbi:MAG: hypothetical protein R6V50_01275 [Thermoplasmatota archaeon]
MPRLPGGGGFGRRGGRGLGGGCHRGPAAECICPNCGTHQPHQPAVPCYTIKCPQCDTPLIRYY